MPFPLAPHHHKSNVLFVPSMTYTYPPHLYTTYPRHGTLKSHPSTTITLVALLIPVSTNPGGQTTASPSPPPMRLVPPYHGDRCLGSSVSPTASAHAAPRPPVPCTPNAARLIRQGTVASFLPSLGLSVFARLSRPLGRVSRIDSTTTNMAYAIVQPSIHSVDQSRAAMPDICASSTHVL